MSQPYHAPPRASFLQKLGPGGVASLGLALLTTVGLLGIPWLVRVRQVLRGAHGDEPAHADAILVLGRRLESDRVTAVFEARLVQAEVLWRQGLAPRIIVAGGITGCALRSEAQAGRDWLVARGIPSGAILTEDRSQHTLENLFNVRAHLRASGGASLLVISDALHLARVRATAAGLRLPVGCVPAQGSPPFQDSTAWWLRAAHEAFLLHWYHTGMLYSRLIRRERQLERVT